MQYDFVYKGFKTCNKITFKKLGNYYLKFKLMVFPGGQETAINEGLKELHIY